MSATATAAAIHLLGEWVRRFRPWDPSAYVGRRCARPLSERLPTAMNSYPPRDPMSLRAVSDSSTSSGSAAAHNREASTTGVPNQSPSSCDASPAAIPIRRRSGRGESTVDIAARSDSAARTALPALLPKTAMNPSPALLTTAPDARSIAARHVVNSSRRMPSASSSPTAVMSAVESTRSQKTTTTVAVSFTRLLPPRQPASSRLVAPHAPGQPVTAARAQICQ